MISTKNIIDSISDIPSYQIFEKYCPGLPALMGQDVRIRSVFNSKDRTPSMFFFYKEGKYFFKDFSTGLGGDAVNFVMHLYKLESRVEALNKIIQDFRSDTVITDKRVFTVEAKHTIEAWGCRSWNADDAKYWTQFNISSKLLERYNVRPLEYVLFGKKNENGEYSFVRKQKRYMYGFFLKNENETSQDFLYKIYEPYNKERKFTKNSLLKKSNILIGSQQLQGKPNLCIISSLKDGLSLLSLGYDIDILVPDSENTIIQRIPVAKNTFTFFDYDVAGQNAKEKYENIGIKGIILPMKKDLSDSIKEYGVRKVKEVLDPLIKNIIV